jgi:hypothetical protein
MSGGSGHRGPETPVTEKHRMGNSYSGHRGPETPVTEKLRMGNSYPETPGVCLDTLENYVRIFQTMNRTIQI